MGGAGLTQKARTVLQITDTDTSERYLTIVKGNYTSKEFKSKSTVLNFDEDTLLFSNTGKFVESKSIGENSGGIRSSPSKELLLKNQLNDILSPNPLNHTDLVQQLMNKLSVSESTAKRRITSALNHELISSDGSLYSLKNEEPITENT